MKKLKLINIFVCIMIMIMIIGCGNNQKSDIYNNDTIAASNAENDGSLSTVSDNNENDTEALLEEDASDDTLSANNVSDNLISDSSALDNDILDTRNFLQSDETIENSYSFFGTADNKDMEIDELTVNWSEVFVYEQPVVMYASQTVNIRKGPDKSFELLGSYALNDEITLIGESTTSLYKEIMYNDEPAFVYGGYLCTEKIDLEALKKAQEEAAAAQAAAAQAEQEAAQAAQEAQASSQTVVANPAGILFIGDSRTCQMKNASAGGGCTWICEYGSKYEWFEETAVPQADGLIGKGTMVVICMGVNDPDKCSSYASLINSKSGDWIGRGAKLYYVSVNPVEAPYDFKDNDIASFNANMPGMLSGVKWIDTASIIKRGGFVLEDGIHYDAVGNLTIFNLIIASLK